MLELELLKKTSHQLFQIYIQVSKEDVDLTQYEIYTQLLDKIVKSTGPLEHKTIPSTLNDHFLEFIDGNLLKYALDTDTLPTTLVPSGKSYSYSKELISTAIKTKDLFEKLFLQVLKTGEKESEIFKGSAINFHTSYQNYSAQWLREMKKIEIDAITPLNNSFKLLEDKSKKQELIDLELFKTFTQIAEQLIPSLIEIDLPKTIDPLLLNTLLKKPAHNTPIHLKVIQLAFQQGMRNVKELLLECKKEGLMFTHYSSKNLNSAISDLMQLYTLSEKYKEDPLWKTFTHIPYEEIKKAKLTDEKCLKAINLYILLNEIERMSSDHSSVSEIKNIPFKKSIEYFKQLTSEEVLVLKNSILHGTHPSSCKLKNLVNNLNTCLILDNIDPKKRELKTLLSLVVKMHYQSQ